MDKEVEVLDPDFDSQELFLDFLSHEDDASPEYIKRRVSDALSEFGFDEILAENGMEEDEALGILFELGYVGLPEAIEYEENDEEVQDIQED